MNRRHFLTLPAAALSAQSNAPESRVVHPGPNGKLAYTPDANGNTIPDFSNAGYGGGGVPIPDAPVRVTVKPVSGDAGAVIQAAIDKVAATMPEVHSGLRGAVLLARGNYPIGGSLRIPASGVVLRGEDGATIVGTGKKQRALIEVRGGAAEPERQGRRIKDEYVPVGARIFRVTSTAGLRPGATVAVRRISNKDWIHFIGMDRILQRPNSSTTRQWEPFNLEFERVITSIDGDRVTIDAPITCAIEQRWGGGEVLQFDEFKRIRNVGVENLRGVSEFDPKVTADLRGEKYQSDEEHAWSFVQIDGALNAWVRGVTARHFGYACVEIRRARWVTVRDCVSQEPISKIDGSRRYAFSTNGQLCLIENCRADKGRHDWVVGARVCGPNVFLRCTSGKMYATSEPHHRWSVGGLYDNVKSNIALQDRQWMGTGHGWAGANYVAWNCEGSLVCQQPPSAQNWAIGQVGTKEPGAFRPRPDGYWESLGHHVQPASLYEAQLHDRRR